ncbi:MAG: topoisomerase DNA-binding C4 zinc finger domain-containing protein [Bradyrhizobium sp.]|nr:topoisomerase DNA-binding C4 zinc finger domain-containing protein [Bradyrhizobium sp.]
MTETKVTCPDCGAPMRLRQTQRFTTKDGQPRKFYGCSRFPQCQATHGAHPDGRPLGVPGNAETKAARHRAHAVFDAIWESGRLKRKAAYLWLSAKLGRDAHMGEMNIEQCEEVVKICEEFDVNDSDAVKAAETIRAETKEYWAKQKAKRDKYENEHPEAKTKRNNAKAKRQRRNRTKRKAEAAES